MTVFIVIKWWIDATVKSLNFFEKKFKIKMGVITFEFNMYKYFN